MIPRNKTTVAWLVSIMLGLPLACRPAQAALMIKYLNKTVVTYPEGTMVGGPGGKGQPAPKEEKTERVENVRLQRDGFSIESENASATYDITHKKVFSVDGGAHKYREADLHSLVYFYIMERQNRGFLKQVLEKSGIAAKEKDTSAGAGFDEFGTECMFPLGGPESDKQSVDVVEASGETRFMHDGKETAAVTYSNTPIDDETKRSYMHLFCYVLHVHPKVRQSILANGHLFEKLRLIYPNGAGMAKSELALQGTNAVADKQWHPSTDFVLEHPAKLAPIEASLAKLGTTKLPTKEETIAFAKAAEAKGNYFDAFLGLLEYGLMTGDHMTDEIKAIRNEIQLDADAAKFMPALGPRNQEEAEAALAAIQKIDRSKLKKAEVVDIIQANLMDSLGKPEAVDLMISALTRNPLVVGAYVDLGGMLSHQYDTETAWACYDQARRLNAASPMLQQVTSVETRMENDFPDFF